MRFPTPARKLFGACLILIAIVLSIVSAYKAQQDTRQLSMRQDLVDAVLHSSHHAMAAMDADGKIILWNDAVQRLTGYSLQDIQQKGLRVLFCSPQLYQEHQQKATHILSDTETPPRVAIARCSLKAASGVLIPVLITIYTYDTSVDGRFALVRISPEDTVIDVTNPKYK